MVDTTVLFIASMETKYVILVSLSIVCAGLFAALYFSLKRNHLHLNTKDVKRL